MYNSLNLKTEVFMVMQRICSKSQLNLLRGCEEFHVRN